MQPGTIVLAIIAAAIIYYFFGLKMVFWCILLSIVIAIICFFYPIFVREDKFPDLEKKAKKLWTKYEKWEDRIFRKKD